MWDTNAPFPTPEQILEMYDRLMQPETEEERKRRNEKRRETAEFQQAILDSLTTMPPR